MPQNGWKCKSEKLNSWQILFKISIDMSCWISDKTNLKQKEQSQTFTFYSRLNTRHNKQKFFIR